MIKIDILKTPLPNEQEVEIVERKGAGHPDTICDGIVEQISTSLSRYYLEEFGAIMHHNVDKALLIAGKSEPSYGGGKIKEPMELIVGGRAIMQRGNRNIEIEQIAYESVTKHLSCNFRYIKPEKDIKISIKTKPGSKSLIELFEKYRKGEIPLSNDTSCGTGFYPLTKLESVVYKTERYLNSKKVKELNPFIGEDIKVMGVRLQNQITLTIAVAFVDKHIASLEDYIHKKETISNMLKRQEWIKDEWTIDINTADSYKEKNIYLTVTGTSAEQGDDGQVGRGNRYNGLITPNRPMNMEATAGKNPVSHVGKIYNIFATELSKQIVKQDFAEVCYTYLISQIGKPINTPQILHVSLKNPSKSKKEINEFCKSMLDNIPFLWKDIVAGKYKPD